MSGAEIRVLLRGIEEKTVRDSMEGRVTEKIGPFLAAAHATCEIPWLSYAIPLSDERETGDVEEAVGRLRGWFVEKRRRLRCEILEPLWPELAGRMVGCGMRIKERMPIMLCGREGMREVAWPAGVEILSVGAGASDGELREAMEVSRRAFGEAEVTPEDVARKRGELASGRYRSAVARVDGAAAGAGSMSVGNDELVGIATLPEFRGRGIGAAVSEFLVAEHFARGAELVWLSAAEDGARRIYERIGFVVVGDQINLMDSDGATS
jgi:ribosomal protein S18 acetylase RimI-like enzyme